MIARPLLITALGAVLTTSNAFDPDPRTRSTIPARIVAAKAYQSIEHYDLLAFSVNWPAEIPALPNLVDHLTAEVAAQRLVRRASALQDKRDGYTIERFYHRRLGIAGRSDRLLSISDRVDTWFGDAHRWRLEYALLWDLRTDRMRSMDDLFDPAFDWMATLNPLACQALDRVGRRHPLEMPGDRPIGIGVEYCLATLQRQIGIAPSDKDGNGRFDHLKLTINSTKASPYDNGLYVASIAVQPALLNGMKDEFRPSFEAQTQ